MGYRMPERQFASEEPCHEGVVATAGGVTNRRFYGTVQLKAASKSDPIKSTGKRAMNSAEILEKLKNTLQESYSIDISGLDVNSKLGDIGVDSLLLVNIMLDIESELGFNFQSMNLPPDPSLGDVSQAISENLNRVG
jgi:acyl carrier protein